MLDILTLGDNGFAADNNYGTRDKELMLAALTARQGEVTAEVETANEATEEPF